MAKSISHRRSDSLGTFRSSTAVPGLKVDPVAYFSPPRGINTLAPMSRMPVEYSPHIRNLMLDEGVLKSRLGTEALGNHGTDVMAVLAFTAQSGVSVLLRITRTGLYSWNGSSWGQVFGISFNGALTDKFTWTGWGNELLLCNGVDKIKSYNIVTGEIKVLTESSPCRHLTSFNGRVIASAVVEGSFLPYRVRWSTKLNHEDWTAQSTTDAIGAGYEDLLASPGGNVDEVMGVFPLSDDTALMVRENSLWFMLVAGDVNAPHRFSRLSPEIGSRARHSIQATPYGIVMVSLDDVLVVNQGGPQSIGEQIRRQLHREITSYPNLDSSYDPNRQEYRLSNGRDVWRWSFIDKGWTRDEYPFNVRHLSSVSYRTLGLTFDELTGTFDELEGTFDDLVRQSSDNSMHFVLDDDNVVHESAGASKDNEDDAAIEIRTGLLQGGSILDRTELIEAQLEYECEMEQVLFFEYSLDKGNSWNSYSQATVLPTSGPSILPVRRTLTSHNLQVRVRAPNLGKLTLLSLSLFVVKGVRVSP
jgi:hypothetical protein